MEKPSLHDNCPFANKVSVEGGERIEGRFSALETQVGSLTHGLEAMERTVTEGFKAVFAKIDTIATQRTASTIPWIMTGFAVLSLCATVGYQSISGVSSGITKAEANLALANSRELQYREDKGRSDERATQVQKALETFTATYQTQHKELDEKLQHETVMMASTFDARILALDSKLQAEMAGWRAKTDDQIEQLREQKTLDELWKKSQGLAPK